MAQQQQPQQQGKGPGRPGAMTVAMAAQKAASGPKVLRIGVIQGTKMSEEKIIRDRGPVTIGSTERNTFTVAANDVPSSFELFSMAGGQYTLNFTDRMDGRVAFAEGVKSLADLRSSGTARKGPTGWQIPVTEQARGKIQLGEVTFLFQFVVPPPPQPKPQLPAAIRAGWVKNIDWTYNACFSFFLVVAIAGIAYVEYIYDPIVDEDALEEANLVRLLTAPAAPEEPEHHDENAGEDQNAPQQQAAAQPQHQEQHQTAEQRQQAAASAADRRAQQAATAANRAADAAMAALQNSAEFAALTGMSDTGHGSARDALAQGGLMAGTERDLANLGGISNATGQTGVRRGGLAAAGGSLGGRGLGASGTVAASGDQVGTGGEIVRERVIHGSADIGSGDSVGGEGEVDANAVARIIRGQLGGIRSCYERALRNNPTLQGRLEVHFTIGTSGRITSANSSGLGAAPEVGSCVTTRIRGLVFPAPSGGSVEFSFPFTFTPGG